MNNVFHNSLPKLLLLMHKSKSYVLVGSCESDVVLVVT